MNATSTAITNVRIFNGEGLTDLQSLVIEGGLITNKSAAAKTVDEKGGTLLPGFIDGHIHLTGIENLQQAAFWGITTKLDMGTPSRQLVDSLRNQSGLTDIRSPQSLALDRAVCRPRSSVFPHRRL